VPSGPATLRHQHSTHCSNQAKLSQRATGIKVDQLDDTSNIKMMHGPIRISNRDFHKVLGVCQHLLVCLAIPAFDRVTGLGKNSLYHNRGF